MILRESLVKLLKVLPNKWRPKIVLKPWYHYRPFPKLRYHNGLTSRGSSMKPRKSIIAAMARNNVIGNENQLPWHLPADLQHFKKTTMNKPIIMGRKTFESVGRPLPERQNIVVTRNRDLQFDGCDMARDLDQALAIAGSVPEVMICGGAAIYQDALPMVDRMYLTFIDLEVAGDTFFPDWNIDEWTLVSSETHDPDEKNAYAYRFEIFERRQSA